MLFYIICLLFYVYYDNKVLWWNALFFSFMTYMLITLGFCYKAFLYLFLRVNKYNEITKPWGKDLFLYGDGVCISILYQIHDIQNFPWNCNNIEFTTMKVIKILFIGN